MRKLTSRWIPHNLSEENKKERFRICRQNLAKLKSGKWRLCDVVTGDESWMYHWQIKKKCLNASWCGEGQNARAVLRRRKFDAKTMFTIFFRSSGIISIKYLDRGKTINHELLPD